MAWLLFPIAGFVVLWISVIWALAGPAATEVRKPDESSFVGGIRFVNATLGNAETIMLAFFLVSLIGVAVFQSLAWKIFAYSASWSDEIIRNSVFYLATFGAALASSSDQTIKMDAITRTVGPMTRIKIRLITRAFTMFVGGCLVYGGWVFVQTTTGEHYWLIPKNVVVLSLPVCVGLICLHTFLFGIIDFIYLRRGESPPEPDEPAVH